MENSNKQLVNLQAEALLEAVYRDMRPDAHKAPTGVDPVAYFDACAEWVKQGLSLPWIRELSHREAESGIRDLTVFKMARRSDEEKAEIMRQVGGEMKLIEPKHGTVQ